MKKLALLLALTLLLGILSGCAGEEAYVPTGDGLSDVTRPSELPTVPEVTAPGGLNTDEAGFTMAYYPDAGFNPYVCTNINNRMIFSLLYQSLFVTDRTYQAEPMLCKEYAVSEDQKTWVFTLEQATFSDGTKLTAEDVVRSLKEAKSEDYYEGRFEHIESVSVHDGNTVKIVTDCPMEQLPLLLDIPIVRGSQAEESMPGGTGPYILERTGDGLALVRRNDWWCDAQIPLDAAQIPLMKGEDATQIRDEFEFGSLGVSTADPGSASYAAYRSDYELWDAESGIFLYLGCNSRSSVLSNTQVRTALSQAIDRAGILASCYNGFGAPASLPASPDSPFYDRNLAQQVAYDPDILRQTLADAGLAGKTVRLLVHKGDSVRLQAARQIADMIAGCGLNVELLEYDYTDYRAVLRDGTFDLYLGQTKLSPNMDLTEFFKEDGSLSWGGMESSACYAMCLEALENSGNYYNLHQMIQRDSQLIPVLFRSYAVYAERGLADDLAPARDNVFYYSLGKSLSAVRTTLSE